MDTKKAEMTMRNVDLLSENISLKGQLDEATTALIKEGLEVHRLNGLLDEFEKYVKGGELFGPPTRVSTDWIWEILAKRKGVE